MSECQLLHAEIPASYTSRDTSDVVEPPDTKESSHICMGYQRVGGHHGTSRYLGHQGTFTHLGYGGHQGTSRHLGHQGTFTHLGYQDQIDTLDTTHLR